MIAPALRIALAAFDDAALATLANVGLVRRARRDVEDGKARLVSATTGSVVVEADGQRVTLDARGPRVAPCSCKAAALCRHRIAAVLLVQGLESEANDAPDIPQDTESPDILPPLDPAALERWAGKAAWRAALELLETAEQVEPSATAIAVRFADLDGPVRILRGQGFDGIVSKAAKGRAKAFHAAAVLAAHRHFGRDLPVAPEAESADAAATIPVDGAFLKRVEAALCDVATLGFNLAPLPVEEALFELSVSSRADSLPRLAAMLRAIAAQMRLRRQRALAFDPERLLELAATASALARALAAASPERAVLLAGKVRRDFTPAPVLHLVGCGAERWQTETGARGVTAWFVDPADGRWLSTTLARGPGQAPRFLPAEAWRSDVLWQAEPMAAIAHARIALEGAGISPDGRLSAPAAARARIVEREIRPDPDWPGVVRDWRDLRGTWLAQAGLGLDASADAAVCLLAPEAVAPPWFDDLAQQLVWPLRDGAGNWLALTLDQEEPVATAIEALEAQVGGRAGRGWQGLVLVRVSRVGDGLEIRPITLFGPDRTVDLSLWQRPYRSGDVPRAGAMREWLARLRANRERRFAHRAHAGTRRVLMAAWRHLLDRAEAGPALAGSLDRALAAQVEQLDRHGLPVLAQRMRGAGTPSVLLEAAYALLLARQQRCEAPLLQ